VSLMFGRAGRRDHPVDGAGGFLQNRCSISAASYARRGPGHGLRIDRESPQADRRRRGSLGNGQRGGRSYSGTRAGVHARKLLFGGRHAVVVSAIRRAVWRTSPKIRCRWPSCPDRPNRVEQHRVRVTGGLAMNWDAVRRDAGARSSACRCCVALSARAIASAATQRVVPCARWPSSPSDRRVYPTRGLDASAIAARSYS
jgi:hypothetical protein